MSLKKYYEDQHAAELKRKAELQSALSMPVGIVGIVVGAIAYLARDVKFPFSCLQPFQLTALVLAFIACLFSGYYLFRSLNGYTYGYPATTLQIKNYFDKLKKFHLESGKNEVDSHQIAEVETIEYLSSEHAKYADLNAANNDRKSAFLNLGNVAMFFAVLFLLVAGFFQVTNLVFASHCPFCSNDQTFLCALRISK
jgi:hypothetical protein